MDLNLKDKVALVTGGSRGLGRGMCLSLAEEGVKVAVNYVRSKDKTEAVVEEIRAKYDVDALAVGGDVAKEADVLEMFRLTAERFSQIDILVNNAALCPTCRVKDMSLEEWSRTIEVNLTGTFLASREFVKRCVAAGRPGRIVNIASQAAFRASTTGHAPYDASKGGIVSFTIALAREVAQKGIGVNAVAPGLVLTEMVAKVLKENEQKYLNRIPLHRIAEPAEVADVVTFLASERAGYMTGATVDVTGGMLMR